MQKIPGKKLEECQECGHHWWYKAKDIEEILITPCPKCGCEDTETIDAKADFED